MWACEIPDLLANSAVQELNIKKNSQIPLTEQEKERLESYREDYETYALLQERSYSCPQHEKVSYLDEAAIKKLEEDIVIIEKKWADEKDNKLIFHEDRVRLENGFYDVDLGEGGYNFE